MYCVPVMQLNEGINPEYLSNDTNNPGVVDLCQSAEREEAGETSKDKSRRLPATKTSENSSRLQPQGTKRVAVRTMKANRRSRQFAVNNYLLCLV